MLIIITKEKSQIFNNTDKYIILEKVCLLKQIKNKNNVLIIGDINLNNDGLVEELNYYIDEVFISVKIDFVISLKKTRKINEVCDFYNVKLINI